NGVNMGKREASRKLRTKTGNGQGSAWSPLLFVLYLEPLAQIIRRDQHIKGVTIKGKEHNLACYADDILIYLGQPTTSLPKLVQKINMNKTRTLSPNYNPPLEILPMMWQAESLKYLINCVPLHTKIIEDMKQWNLIPYFTLYSRIESIKMSVLPRIVSFKTLQLTKDKGRWGFPSLRNYYRAAQMKTVINWFDVSYNAQWKTAALVFLDMQTIFTCNHHSADRKDVFTEKSQSVNLDFTYH
uniref:Reverse transcriptase domain-containing protein n=1 Tax=Periophthalmus magnuspinnatus TaxID=409849 RepID=A0A3B4A6I8_9GOBI